MKSPDVFGILRPIEAFEKLGINYYISGSVASSTYGIARATIDEDLVTDLTLTHIDALAKMLESDYYINTDKRAASFEIDIKDEYIPNVYITATLFRPHKVSDIPLTVAHGFHPVIVEKPTNKLPVEIVAVKKSRSNIRQKIKIKSP